MIAALEGEEDLAVATGASGSLKKGCEARKP
jgi:hypothetical protein